MPTKKELLDELEKGYQEYCGFHLEAVVSDTKAHITHKIHMIRRANIWKRYAKRLTAQIVEKYGEAYWMMPESQKDREKAHLAYTKASDYWFKS